MHEPQDRADESLAPVSPDEHPMPTSEASSWPEDDPAHVAARNARLEELRQLYPRQRAAIRDEWDGMQLVEPFVLAVSTDYGVLDAAINALPPEQRGQCCIHFLLPRYWAKLVPLFYRGPAPGVVEHKSE